LKEDPQVNYRYGADKSRMCGQCVHFREGGACEIVAGLIRRVDTCDKFKADESGLVRAVLVGLDESEYTAYTDEVTPPGYENIVRGLKKSGNVDNPWAVAWWMR